MSYGYFAEFYDSFTDDVNYDKIEKFVCSLLSREGINGGLLLDLAWQIARMGSTGISSGPHCHFGMTRNGTIVDPLNYLP